MTNRDRGARSASFPSRAALLLVVLVGCSGPGVDPTDASAPIDAQREREDAESTRSDAGHRHDADADAAVGCPARGGDADEDGACAMDDCDDRDPSVHPGATEICDGVDQDCDPLSVGERDGDGDGDTSNECCNPAAGGAMHCGSDCDDARASRSSLADETCTLVDDDCDGAIDEGGVCRSCELGYRPDGAACLDIDECATGASACHPSRACENAPGSYACGDCADGYRNAGDHDCQDVDECVEGVGEGAATERACDVRRTCTNAPGRVLVRALRRRIHGRRRSALRRHRRVPGRVELRGAVRQSRGEPSLRVPHRARSRRRWTRVPLRRFVERARPSAGALSPSFAPNTERFELVLPHGTSTFTLTPTVPQPGWCHDHRRRTHDRVGRRERGVHARPGESVLVLIDVRAESGRITSYGVLVHARVIAVSAGAQNTCAVLADGGARCWGDNGHGQVGDGTTTERRRGALVVGAHRRGGARSRELARLRKARRSDGLVLGRQLVRSAR